MTTPTNLPPCTTGITRSSPLLRSRWATAATFAVAFIDTTSGFMISLIGTRSSAGTPSAACASR